MSYSAYEGINSLEDVQFIGGTEYTLTFDVLDDTGAPLSLAGTTCTWSMSPYGYPSVVTLSKTGSVSLDPSNRFAVTLTATDTANLSGKYIQQPVVKDNNNKYFRPGQGVITIVSRNRDAYYT